MKKILLLTGALLVLSQTLPAQSLLYVRNGCAVDDAEMGQNHYVFDPSDEAQRIIRTIMEANVLQPNFVIKSGDVKNALATIENGRRYIIYNTAYVERIKRSGGSDWPAFYVFAHEIAHHLNNDRFEFDLNLEEDRKKSKEQELKADLFAGAMLYRLGATIDEAQKGIGDAFTENGSRSHPPRRARLEAIASGWKKVYDQNGGVQSEKIQINKKTSESKENHSDAENSPDNCYALNIQSEYFGFRTRKLTQAELDACNQCQSYIEPDGSHSYEDMSKQSCKLKKRIDDETSLGSLRNGTVVQLLNKDGSFFRVRDVSSGRVGYIAGKYGGASTLVKTTCN